MVDQSNSVLLKILDKEFRVVCRPEEREGLLVSASYLTDKIKALRGRGKVLGNDRVAITVALNVVHELHECRQQSAVEGQGVGGDLVALRNKIEAVLN